MSDENRPVVPPQAATIDMDAYQDALGREVRLKRVLEQGVTVTWVLLVTNVLIWAVAFFWGDTLGIRTPYFNNEQLVLYTGMKVNALVESGQWWRLVSNQFVHLDVMHIGFNAYGLYVLGPLVERFYGWKRFLLIYLVAGTVGSVASLLFVAAPSGGASGAIYGLVGALLVFGFKHRRELPQRVSRALTTGMLPWVAFSLGIGFLDSLPMDNAAHLGGLITGGLLVLVTNSRLTRPEDAKPSWAVRVATAAAIFALVWTALNWGQEAAKCVTDGRAAYFQCYPDLQNKLEGRE